jgi:uncharacterized Zn finger protein
MAKITMPCPVCSGAGIWLEVVSRDSYVDYYRCSHCAHVWTTLRHGESSVRVGPQESGPVATK